MMSADYATNGGQKSVAHPTQKTTQNCRAAEYAALFRATL